MQNLQSNEEHWKKYKGRRAEVSLSQEINTVRVIYLLLDMALHEALGFSCLFGLFYFNLCPYLPKMTAYHRYNHTYTFSFTQTSIFPPFELLL